MTLIQNCFRRLRNPRPRPVSVMSSGSASTHLFELRDWPGIKIEQAQTTPAHANARSKRPDAHGTFTAIPRIPISPPSTERTVLFSAVSSGDQKSERPHWAALASIPLRFTRLLVHSLHGRRLRGRFGCRGRHQLRGCLRLFRKIVPVPEIAIERTRQARQRAGQTSAVPPSRKNTVTRLPCGESE